MLHGTLAVVGVLRKNIISQYLNRFMDGEDKRQQLRAESCGSNFVKNGSSDKIFHLCVILSSSPVKQKCS